MSKRGKGLPQILLLPIQHILVHIYPYDYNLPVTCSECSSNCCFMCIQSKIYYRLKKQREACHGKEGRLPRITDWMTRILGWQSQNIWIIWSYTEAESKKISLKSMDMCVLPRTTDLLIQTERRRLRHLFFLFFNCHFICCMACYISVSQSPNL